MVTATIFILFKANTKESTKEVARPKAAQPPFVMAAEGRHFCILALNKVNIVAITSILVTHVGNGRSEHVRLDIMFLAINVHI